MRSRRPAKSAPSPAAETKADLRVFGLAALTTLLTATPLIPAESVAELGVGLFLVMLWLLLLLAWAVIAMLRGGAELRAGPTVAAMAVFVGLVALSGWMNAWEGNPRATINSVWQWVSLGAAFFLVRQWIVRPIERRAVCAVMIGLAVALSSLGYYQYFVTRPQTWEYFHENPEQALREANIANAADPQAQKLLQDRVLSTEPIATFALTNSFAGFLTPWLVIAAGIGLSLWRRPVDRGHWAVIGSVLALAVIGGCFFLTKSRTAWGAALCGLLLLAYYGRRGSRGLDWRLPLVAALGAVALFLAAVMVGGLDVQVLSEAPKSLLYRFEYWQSTAAMIRDHLLWGVGVGNFQSYYTAYKLPQASETIADPHNFLLEIWANSGTPALVAFVAMLGLFVWQVRLRSRPPEDAANSAIPAASKKPASAVPTASVYAIYGGAVGGVLLAYPVGLAAQFPPDLALLAVGLPPAAACVAMLHPWTRGGCLPLHLPLVAVAALLITFLAAGGIGFASVATSLWLLMGLALNATNDEGRRTKDEGGNKENIAGLSRLGAVVAAVGVVGLILACYWTAYRPTLASLARMAEAEEQLRLRQPHRAAATFRAAADVDPWSRRPWEALMSLYGEHWIATGAPSAREAFEHAWREAIRRSGPSHGLWKAIGDWYLEAYRRRPDPRLLDASIAAYRKAVAYYPASAPLRTELAWRLATAGEDAEAAEHAKTALALDQMNPHEEQKLAQFHAPAGAEAENLEHLAEKLRKLEGS